ncbi:hypothetical protein H5410_050523 [Solanum commersonii]|uniref:Uncharacterized protein n=1 Tax=Solanum commersonii TaxID=4109 RepID=A0A9J5WY49_SOLCO|nr:hypothetical protein H5410_050523 [Solanum commersonii]
MELRFADRILNGQKSKANPNWLKTKNKSSKFNNIMHEADIEVRIDTQFIPREFYVFYDNNVPPRFNVASTVDNMREVKVEMVQACEEELHRCSNEQLTEETTLDRRIYRSKSMTRVPIMNECGKEVGLVSSTSKCCVKSKGHPIGWVWINKAIQSHQHLDVVQIKKGFSYCEWIRIKKIVLKRQIQLSNIPLVVYGVTQPTPRMQKNMFHRLVATLQWRNKCPLTSTS